MTAIVNGVPYGAPGDVPADDHPGLWGAERDPADNFGIGHDQEPSVGDSPYWADVMQGSESYPEGQRGT